MAKTATFTVRLDEDLKNDAQAVLEGMGMPMSLAVEMFLRQVVEKGKLPFPVGTESDDEAAQAEREKRERDFWRAYILWNFRVSPHFDSLEVERRAVAFLEWDGKAAGEQAKAYLYSQAGEPLGKMPSDCMSAYLDISAAQSLLADAKELIYWALGMERTFVPSLAGRYGADCDAWRYRSLRDQRRARR